MLKFLRGRDDDDQAIAITRFFKKQTVEPIKILAHLVC